MDVQPMEVERRRHRRIPSQTVAFVKTKETLQQYHVRNLSVGGAMLSGGPELKIGTKIQVILNVPLYPPIRIMAKVVHTVDMLDGTLCYGIEFRHKTDVTEDQIQSALLSELERAARTEL